MTPILDYHIHSQFSPDGMSSMESICREAIRIGVSEIGFTEHFDRNPLSYQYNAFKLEAWAKEIERCRMIFEDTGLSIRAGIEVGEPHVYRDDLDVLLKRYSFDFVLGSVHFIGSETYFLPEYFEVHSEEEGFRIYFEELEQMCSDSYCDVVAHFDVPARVSHRKFGAYDPTRFEQYIRPVLSRCIENNLAIEVNSAGKRTSLRSFTPDLEILSWYREMGGRNVTYGSDAHHLKDIASFYTDAMQLIEQLDLSLCRFDQKARLPFVGSLNA